MSYVYSAEHYAKQHRHLPKKRRQYENMQYIIEWVAENPFCADRKYSSQELDMYATMLTRGTPGILTPDLLYMRLKREIYVTDGTPDAALVQGMYWRTHPSGRKFNTKEQRQEDSRRSFYR